MCGSRAGVGLPIVQSLPGATSGRTPGDIPSATSVRTPAEGLDNPHDVRLAPSPLPRVAQYVLIALWAVAMVVVAVFIATSHWRRATFLLGAAFAWIAVLRFTCDSRVIGLLSVRSRRFDSLFTVSVGGLLMFLAASVDALGS